MYSICSIGFNGMLCQENGDIWFTLLNNNYMRMNFIIFFLKNAVFHRRTNDNDTVCSFMMNNCYH